ncbi:MAG: class I SAM-dependent methyltransferase, partial [Gammaproteobacteria bacterium]
MPLNRLKLYLSMVRYGNAHNRDFAREHYAFLKTMLRQLQALDKDPRGLRVLDVGCGKAYWLTLLLHSYGAQATGIDTEFMQPGRSPVKYLRILRENGPERAMRSLVWDIFYAAPYYRQLAAESDFPLRFDGLDARRLGVTELDFPASTFDVVVSHEVFEHIADIPAAVRSLRRV